MFEYVVKPERFPVGFDLTVSSHIGSNLSNVIDVWKTSKFLYKRSGHLE